MRVNRWMDGWMDGWMLGKIAYTVLIEMYNLLLIIKSLIHSAVLMRILKPMRFCLIYNNLVYNIKKKWPFLCN